MKLSEDVSKREPRSPNSRLSCWSASTWQAHWVIPCTRSRWFRSLWAIKRLDELTAWFNLEELLRYLMSVDLLHSAIWNPKWRLSQWSVLSRCRESCRAFPGIRPGLISVAASYRSQRTGFIQGSAVKWGHWVVTQVQQFNALARKWRHLVQKVTHVVLPPSLPTNQLLQRLNNRKMRLVAETDNCSNRLDETYLGGKWAAWL